MKILKGASSSSEEKSSKSILDPVLLQKNPGDMKIGPSNYIHTYLTTYIPLEDINNHLEQLSKLKGGYMGMYYILGIEMILRQKLCTEKLLNICLNSPILALEYLSNFKDENISIMENSVAQSASVSYLYAVRFLKGRFLKGEPAITSCTLTRPSYIKFLKNLKLNDNLSN